MNCDHVFEVVTRGPFPTGDSSDAAVERHLHVCHECRNLAEALRPAVSLFHEALHPEGGAALPGYTAAIEKVDGSATAVGILVCEATSASPRQTIVPWEKRTGGPVGWIVALGVAGVLVGTMAWTWMASRTASPGEDVVAAGAGLTGAERARLQGMMGATKCMMTVDGQRDFDCCPRCHKAPESPGPSANVASRLLAACGVCHQPNQRQLSAGLWGPVLATIVRAAHAPIGRGLAAPSLLARRTQVLGTVRVVHQTATAASLVPVGSHRPWRPSVAGRSRFAGRPGSLQQRGRASTA